MSQPTDMSNEAQPSYVSNAEEVLMESAKVDFLPKTMEDYITNPMQRFENHLKTLGYNEKTIRVVTIRVYRLVDVVSFGCMVLDNMLDIKVDSKSVMDEFMDYLCNLPLDYNDIMRIHNTRTYNLIISFIAKEAGLTYAPYETKGSSESYVRLFQEFMIQNTDKEEEEVRGTVEELNEIMLDSIVIESLRKDEGIEGILNKLGELKARDEGEEQQPGQEPEHLSEPQSSS